MPRSCVFSISIMPSPCACGRDVEAVRASLCANICKTGGRFHAPPASPAAPRPSAEFRIPDGVKERLNLRSRFPGRQNRAGGIHQRAAHLHHRGNRVEDILLGGTPARPSSVTRYFTSGFSVHHARARSRARPPAPHPASWPYPRAERTHPLTAGRTFSSLRRFIVRESAPRGARIPCVYAARIAHHLAEHGGFAARRGAGIQHGLPLAWRDHARAASTELSP